MFQLKSTQSWHPLHLLAQNLPVNSVVLENADFNVFVKTLRERTFEIVAIGYTSIATATVLKMVKLIKEHSPQSKIVVGGYGTCTFKDPDTETLELKKLVDEICFGEGIAFMRAYLKKHWNITSETEFVQQLLPSRAYMFRSWIPVFDQLIVIHSLGCPNKCVFCSTSAQFNGEKILLTTPRMLFDQLLALAKKYPSVQSAIIYEEDFLANRKKTMEFIDLVKNSDIILQRPVTLTVFSSARSVAQYSMEELLWCGIGTIFIGVESFNMEILNEENLSKRDAEIEKLFDQLHDHGIMTLGSMIIGWDGQNENNICEEIDRYVALNPTLYQVIPLHPVPGTQLWNRLKKSNRITAASFSSESIFESNFDSKQLSRAKILELVKKTYSSLVDEGGPWPFRMFEIMVRGYITMNAYSSGEIYTIRKKVYKKLISRTAPFAFVSILMFGGKGFRMRWANIFYQYFKMTPFQSVLLSLCGLLSYPVLQLFYLFVRIRFRCSHRGDQPRMERYEYNGVR